MRPVTYEVFYPEKGKSHHVYHYQLVERMERAKQLNPSDVTVDQEGRGRG